MTESPLIRYPSAALPASQAAWAYFQRGEQLAPRVLGEGLLEFGDGVEDPVASAFWHLCRWEERPGSPRDRHGRFAAVSALCDPEHPAVDQLLARFRDATGLRAAGGFRVVLTHDIDTPWRWSGRDALRASAARARRAATGRDGGALAAELRGLAELPRHRLRGSDPNWSFRRMHEIEQRHGGHSTHFVLAGHGHPADGAAPGTYDRLRARIIEQVSLQGDEVGLHPSYTASEESGRLAAELAELERLTGGPVSSTRFHFLRHDPHRTLPQLERLGVRIDSSQGYADRPGLRAGLSHPYRPYDLERDRPLDLLELPLAVMDATLQDARYLGLNPDQGYRRAVDVLERVARTGGTVAILWHNDRFDRAYARGWDRAYERILLWVRDRGGSLCACRDVRPPG